MGLCQAYNREIAKAIVFLILYAISIFLTFFLVRFITNTHHLDMGMVHTYSTSQKMNQVGAVRHSPLNISPSGFGFSSPQVSPALLCGSRFRLPAAVSFFSLARAFM